MPRQRSLADRDRVEREVVVRDGALTWRAVGRGAAGGAAFGAVVTLSAMFRAATARGVSSWPAAVEEMFGLYVLGCAASGVALTVVSRLVPGRLGETLGWVAAGALYMPVIATMASDAPPPPLAELREAALLGAVLGPLAGVAWRYAQNRAGPA